jgi:hypothetical protein
MLCELAVAGAVPVIVIVYLPAAVLEPAVNVNVEVLVELEGENLAAAPDGNPDAMKLTALVNPFVPLIVSASLPLVPGVTVTLAVAGERVNARAAVTSSVIVVVAVAVPDTPVTVSG